MGFCTQKVHFSRHCRTAKEKTPEGPAFFRRRNSFLCAPRTAHRPRQNRPQAPTVDGGKNTPTAPHFVQPPVVHKFDTIKPTGSRHHRQNRPPVATLTHPF